VPTRLHPEVNRRVRAVAAAAAARYPSPSRPLALPPQGSDLIPVYGDHGPPIVGHSLEVLSDFLGYSRERYRRYGPVSWNGMPGARVVSVMGPDAVGEVLANREGVFLNEPGWNFFIGPFFRRGVMLMDGEEHRYHRRVMQGAFRHERLVGYLREMNPAIRRGIETWDPRDGFRFYWAAKQLTLDIATEVFVGERLGAQSEQINRAFIAAVVAGLSAIRADVPGGGWHRGLEARRLLEGYFRDRLAAKRSGTGNDLFTALCHAETEDGERFSDDDVVNHMIFLLMAAHDTSTITLSMLVYLLGRHPEWQERLRAEALALGKAALDHDDLERLPDLDMAFRETLRYNAPVGMVAREAVRDTALLGRYIPAGTRLMLNLYATQRMPEFWPEPDRFDPERFSPQRREDRVHQYAWVPFGGNVHKCIGMHFGAMEVKAIMHQLLHHFRWTVDADYELPIEYGTGPLPGDGLPIRLKRLSRTGYPAR
jgi:cytochrome P450